MSVRVSGVGVRGVVMVWGMVWMMGMRRQRQQGAAQLLGGTRDDGCALSGQVEHVLPVEGSDEVEGAELLLEVAGQLARREQQRLLVQAPLLAGFERLEPVLDESLRARQQHSTAQHSTAQHITVYV